jgi:hypothetical protein
LKFEVADVGFLACNDGTHLQVQTVVETRKPEGTLSVFIFIPFILFNSRFSTFYFFLSYGITDHT